VQKSLLQNINSPKDLRLLKQDDLTQLAQELRDYIINIVATKEGHLGASLGVVELTKPILVIFFHFLFFSFFSKSNI